MSRERIELEHTIEHPIETNFVSITENLHCALLSKLRLLWFVRWFVAVCCYGNADYKRTIPAVQDNLHLKYWFLLNVDLNLHRILHTIHSNVPRYDNFNHMAYMFNSQICNFCANALWPKTISVIMVAQIMCNILCPCLFNNVYNYKGFIGLHAADVAGQFTAASPTCSGSAFTFRCTVTGDINGVTIWRVGGNSECPLPHRLNSSSICGPSNVFTARSSTGFGTSVSSFTSTLSGTAYPELNGTLVECFQQATSLGQQSKINGTTLILLGQYIYPHGYISNVW